MSRIILSLTVGCLLALTAPLALAQHFVATGQIEGNVCHGFVVESCHLVTLDAVKGHDGEFYTVKRHYSHVSEYSESQHHCWITVKSRGLGIISWVINWFTGPEFYRKDAIGRYVSVDVDYVTFDCIKRSNE